METIEQEIIDSADQWHRLQHELKMKEHELKIKEIHLADARRKKIIENFFDIPGFLLSLIVAILISIITISITSWSHKIIDCSKADQDRIERMKSECEKDPGSSAACFNRIVYAACETRYVYPVKENE